MKAFQSSYYKWLFKLIKYSNNRFNSLWLYKELNKEFMNSHISFNFNIF